MHRGGGKRGTAKETNNSFRVYKKTKKNIEGSKINWCLVTLIYSKQICNRVGSQSEKSISKAHSGFQPWILPQSHAKEIPLWAFKSPLAATWKWGLDEV